MKVYVVSIALHWPSCSPKAVFRTEEGAEKYIAELLEKHPYTLYYKDEFEIEEDKNV